jgi:hypothetical protein
VYSSHIFSVFKLFNSFIAASVTLCVAYCSICEQFLDFLKICGPLCQCNVLGVYVRQLKEVLVYCCIWMVIINMCDPDTRCVASVWSE